MNETGPTRKSKSDSEERFWQARAVPGAAAEGPLLWWACPECLGRDPRRGCPICEGTGQYQAPAPPTVRSRLTPEERLRGAAWTAVARDATQTPPA